jgi:hypothetical protein
VRLDVDAERLGGEGQGAGDRLVGRHCRVVVAYEGDMKRVWHLVWHLSIESSVIALLASIG